MPTISDLLIATLTSHRSVRSFYRILRARERERYNRASVGVAISRLHKRKYIKKGPDGWSLTEKGRKNFIDNSLTYITSPFKNNEPESTIVAFDIPESDRKVRNWLRSQLKIFNYKMLQQSLWIGPGPLPKEFLERLQKLEIRDKVKIFSKIKKLHV